MCMNHKRPNLLTANNSSITADLLSPMAAESDVQQQVNLVVLLLFLWLATL